ncbi:MAG: shikimate dehydrogenase [Armatimonadetes bacterium]|nr:shikimate dehydrogenase [Armatimonadota bacterium]
MSESVHWQDVEAADYGVIGDPVAHSASPRMHAAAYKEAGLSYDYRAVRVPSGEFDQAMRHLESLGYRGLNVTVPLKELAYLWGEGGDPRMGAVNTVRFEDHACVNTDAPGFLRTLRDQRVGPCRVLMLGAGGSARALTVALADAGFEVALYNRTLTRAQELVRAAGVRVQIVSSPNAAGCGLIVNATSAGLQGEAPAMDWQSVEESALAYDLLYGKPSLFLEEASAHRLRVQDGKALLVAQGALSFEWWTGVAAPIEAMMRAIA